MKTTLPLLKTIGALMLLFSANTAVAQQLRVGVLGGLPAGDASDAASFNVGADASLYFLNIKEKVDIGVSAGYSRYFGKSETVNGIKFDYDDFAYIPVSASGRGAIGNSLVYVADVGYAIGLNDVDGGLFYQAKFGWTNTTLDAYLFYNGISADKVNMSLLGLGISFKVL